MSVEIEPATPEDLLAARELLHAQLSDHGIALQPEALERGLRGLLDGRAHGEVLLARRAGEPIGIACVSFIWTLEHGGASAWLDELYVVPHARGSGIGRALVQEVIRRARARGDRAIDLEIESGHERVQSLYARSGFGRHARERWVLRLF